MGNVIKYNVGDNIKLVCQFQWALDKFLPTGLKGTIQEINVFVSTYNDNYENMISEVNITYKVIFENHDFEVELDDKYFVKI